jgi:Terminase large subunit, T4likevirus-type, N-terminal
VSTASLRSDIEKIKARRLARRRDIPADRVAFTRALGVDPDHWQERLLRSESQRILLNVSRQAGKSSMSAIIALHRALTAGDSLVLILAPSERQAKETFGKVADYYRILGNPIAADSDRKLGLQLANRSRIEALPGSEKTIRGFSGASLLIVDEAARVDDGLYYAVRPMLAVSGGSLMLLSTPNGKRGAFFEEWTEGAGWDRYEVTAEECPRIPASFLEEERAALPAFIYDQEYCCAFVDLEDQLFGYDLVTSSITDEVTPLFGEAS